MPVSPGFLTSSGVAEINAALKRLAELERKANAGSAPGAVVAEMKHGVKFWAKITSVGSGKYAFTEQYRSADAFADLPGGRVGTTSLGYARENNGATASTFPFYAELTLQEFVSGAPVYGFDLSAGATGTELKGLTFTSDTDSTADSDPGDGLFKWNNGTQAGATVLYFDNQTADGVSVATFYASLGSGGFIYLQQADDSTKWQLWKWTATPTDGTGYYKFTVTLQANGGTIADAKTVYTQFLPAASGGGGTELKGLTYTSDTDSTADSDPGAGLFKWNNGTQSSATVLYFDDTTADGAGVSASFWTTAAAGFLYLQQADDSTRWQLWRYTAVTDGTGYRKLAVTFLAIGANPIQDAKTVYCIFTPTTLVADESQTDATYSVTADATWEDASGTLTGVTLPSAGTYRLHYKVLFRGYVDNVSGATIYLAARLYNATAGAAVPGTVTVMGMPVANQFVIGTGSCEVEYTAAGAHVIRFECYRTAPGGAGTWFNAEVGSTLISGGSDWRCVIGYERIGG